MTVQGVSTGGVGGRSRAAVLVVAVVGLMAACAPASTIRRSALIPAANLPARVGEPLAEGQGRAVFEVGAVEVGNADPVDLGDLFVQVGTPGVFVPNLHVGGSFYYGLSDNLELGARLQYTNADWADQNVIGVLPFPSDENASLWGVGPGLRANFPLSEGSAVPVWLSLLAEINYTDVPQAVYACSNCDSLGSGELPLYQLDRVEHESFWLPNLAILAGAYVADWSYVGVIFGGESSVTNTGFDNDPSSLNDSTLETVFLGYAGFGVDFIASPLVAGLWAYFPFGGEDQIDFGFRATFQLGVTFGRPE